MFESVIGAPNQKAKRWFCSDTEAVTAGLPLGVMWPSNAVSPEELGRKGWDGNEAIEWLTDVMPISGGPK